MLILTRRVNETIHIGDDIVVNICAVNGKQVKIGIAAPPGLVIRRSELKPLHPKKSGPYR